MKTAEDILNEKGGSVYSVPLEATIYDALQVMTENNVGSVLVKDMDRIVGIWTERNLIQDAMNADFNPRTARIADHMSTDLQYTAHDDSMFDMMDRCVGMRMRRLLIERDGQFMGLLSAGDVMKACLQERDRELKELNAIASWEYYENWK